eukprot:m.279720 g.279720  ORF g.279720 m.279720 type:complete len:208 (+) comp104246_c0_seq1:80-703(+)
MTPPPSLCPTLLLLSIIILDMLGTPINATSAIETSQQRAFLGVDENGVLYITPPSTANQSHSVVINGNLTVDTVNVLAALQELTVQNRLLQNQLDDFKATMTQKTRALQDELDQLKTNMTSLESRPTVKADSFSVTYFHGGYGLRDDGYTVEIPGSEKAIYCGVAEVDVRNNGACTVKPPNSPSLLWTVRYGVRGTTGCGSTCLFLV